MSLWALLGASAAWALNPSLDASQYGHRAWRELDGAGLGTVFAIAQTVDGYMWLATPEALVRFDGIRGVPWRPTSSVKFLPENVRALLGARDGTLWIATTQGLFAIKDGVLSEISELIGKKLNALNEDVDGAIWAGGADGDKALLCAVRKPGVECEGQVGRLGREVLTLYRDDAHALWVVTGDRVWKWGTDTSVFYAIPTRAVSLRSMSSLQDGSLLVGIAGQVMQIADGRVDKLPFPETQRPIVYTKMLRDRDGVLWVSAADSGVVHLHQGHVDVYTAADGLSGDSILDLFEDHEGNIWISTSKGLDQFRPVAAANESVNGLAGRANAVMSAHDGTSWASTSHGVYRRDASKGWTQLWNSAGSLLEDHRGRVWIAGASGLGYVDGGQYVEAKGVAPGTVTAIEEDARGSLWVSNLSVGLMTIEPGGRVEGMHPVGMGPRETISTMTRDPNDGSMWLGLFAGGLKNVQEGHVRKFFDLGKTFRPPAARVSHIRIDPDGTMWVTSLVGFNRIKNGQVIHIDASNGLPCDRLFWSLVEKDALWISGLCGLMKIDKGDLDAWLAAAEHGSSVKIKVRLFSLRDGVPKATSESTTGYAVAAINIGPKLTRMRDGKIWVVTNDNIVSVDPQRIPVNSIVPPVHVEQLISDGQRHPSASDTRLPPLQRNLTIEYTALSFTVPEQVQFKYRLEGFDNAWQDAGSRREAFYTDLPPGHYQFHVVAANNSGLWNNDGATLDFSVEPAWWQTMSFRLACIALAVLSLYGLYRLRLAQISRRFDMSFEARVNERLRIARELHDTLLQTFQGHVLRLQTALQLWPGDDARRILEDGIDQAASAITEGRDAVQGLRAGIAEAVDLGDAMRSLGQALTSDLISPSTKFGVEVHGRSRALHPVVHDDVLRIVGEAVRNAFRHAQPSRVEVEIRYDDHALRVRVLDDGRGMDTDFLQRGREGHFGLRGMRERAKLIGGKLTLWSRRDAGTEVELVVPAARAYASAADPASVSDIDRAD